LGDRKTNLHHGDTEKSEKKNLTADERGSTRTRKQVFTAETRRRGEEQKQKALPLINTDNTDQKRPEN